MCLICLINIQPHQVGVYLEVEDASIVLGEALVPGDDPVEQLLVESETRDGGQQPAVTCPPQRQRHGMQGMSSPYRTMGGL